MPDETVQTKNYTTQGGEEYHVGGKVVIESGGVITPASGTVAAAIATVTGGATVDAEARVAINALLVALRNIGVIAP